MQKVLVFDDHRIVFEGIRMLLGETYELHYAATGNQLREKLQAMKFDAAIVDLDFTDNDSGFNYFDEIKASQAKVIVLTGTATDAKLNRCFQANLAGVVEKQDHLADLGRTVDMVLSGQHVFPYSRVQRLLANDADRLPYLTTRERDVLNQIMLDPSGSLKQIAAPLDISESRVSRIVGQIADKLQVTGLIQIYFEAKRRGY